jgi:DNA-binding transcriptional LysR family regulator
MDLRQVAYTVAVVDEGGFTTAARAMHVTQPTLSESVRSLERELGTQLFYRLGRRVRLTSAGEAFLPGARQLLRDIRTIRAAVDNVRGLTGGGIDLVALPTLAVDPDAELVGTFRINHPRIEVRLHEPDDADGVAAFVLDGRAELGFAELPGPAGLVSVELGRQEVVAVCPPGTRLGRGPRLSIERLADIPLVTTPEGTSTRRLVDQAISHAGFTPIIAVETAQREAVVPLVLAGAGTTFLPTSLAERARQRGAVIVGLDPPLQRDIGVLHRDGPLAPATQAFLTMVSFVGNESPIASAESSTNKPGRLGPA